MIRRVLSKIVSILPLPIRVAIFKSRRYESEIMWNRHSFRDVVNESFLMFLTEEEQSNEKLKETLLNDIIGCYLRYGTTPREYFMCGFRIMDWAKRATFINGRYEDQQLIRLVGLEAFQRDLKDKWNFYCRFKEYFKRQAILISSKKDKESFENFALSHDKVIVKPNAMAKGSGVMIYKNGGDVSLEDFFERMMKKCDKWIVEEVIIQSEIMRQWNASSVNTVRIPSVYKDGQYGFFTPFFRIGRKGMVVDNTGSGGVFANVDINTGRLYTDGCDELGNMYEYHPDSKVVFKNWQIPDWEELISLVKKIHASIPEQVYIGWDFAHTKTGWVLVEGNWGQFASQFVDKVGQKADFDRLLGIK